MPLTVEGATFLTNGEAAERGGVSRQTIWRWRADGKIPAGRQYRGKTILFTLAEIDLIVQYANRMEPLTTEIPGQLGLFAPNERSSNG
jgi:excisionase family DNA binding protein